MKVTVEKVQRAVKPEKPERRIWRRLSFWDVFRCKKPHISKERLDEVRALLDLGNTKVK